MKPTPKPRAVRPMKLWVAKEWNSLQKSCGCVFMANACVLDGDRPVLVIDLSPESVEALIDKVAMVVQSEVNYFNGWSVSNAHETETCINAASKALSAIGIKPARVAKRKKAK